MTSTDERTAVEPVPCRRCHGTGIEPVPAAPKDPNLTPEQQDVLERLAEAGRQRAASNRHTLTGRQALDEAYREIRVHAAEGTRLGIPRVQMTEAVGVSKAAFYAIVAGKTGTS